MKFSFIKEHLQAFPVGAACDTLAVSRAGYYAWLERPESARAKRRVELAVKIKAVHEENRRVYGSPRVFQILKAQGEKVCENTVAAVMRQQRIRAKTKRKFIPRTTDGNHAKPDFGELSRPVAKNVLDRQFQADAPDRKWAVDITYIPTGEGWLYLAGVLDLCSRKIVGWSMADHLRAELPVDALSMAVAQRRPDVGLLHHSDRGVQYVCDDYQHLLQSHGMQLSMSGKGECWLRP